MKSAYLLVLATGLLGCGEDRPAAADTQTAAALISRGDTAPRIEGRVLVLPDRTQQALLTAVPHFRHTPLSDFALEIQQFAPPTETGAPSPPLVTSTAMDERTLRWMDEIPHTPYCSWC